MTNDAQNKTILMLSSNEALLDSVPQLLAPVDFDVIAYQRPQDFLFALKSKTWGLVLLDTSFVGRRRGDLVTAARMIDESAPLIVFVPQNDLPFCVDALRLGADDVLTIPLPAVELKFRVAGRYGQRRYRERPAQPIPVVAPVTTVSSHSKLHDLGLLHELSRFHEYCLRQFIALERRIIDLKGRLDEVSGVARTIASTAGQVMLLVHSDGELLSALQRCAQPHNIIVRQVFTGGEALDYAGQSPVDILICADDLPDLHGDVVVTSLKSEYPYIDAVQLSHWGTPEGVGVWVDDTEEEDLIVTMRHAEDLEHLIDAFVARRSRRIVGKHLADTFKEQHRDFMKKYAQIKHRMRQSLVRAQADSEES